ncbi:MAG: pyridoxamine 5'-phosphate oxidase family protein [candidate division Zixibacteria bacterium]
MNTDEMKQKCLSLMNSTDILYMSTIGNDGFPHIRAVMNLRNKNNYPNLAEVFSKPDTGFQTYFATKTSSDKVKHIAANNSVCLYYCLPEKFQGVMLTCQAQPVLDLKLKQMFWQDDWQQFFPDGYNDPNYTLLHFVPLYAKGWWVNSVFDFKLG